MKKVNLKDVMHGKNVNEDAILKPGDMIFVPETFITSFRKYVPYSVNAGTYLTQWHSFDERSHSSVKCGRKGEANVRDEY